MVGPFINYFIILEIIVTEKVLFGINKEDNVLPRGKVALEKGCMIRSIKAI